MRPLKAYMNSLSTQSLDKLAPIVLVVLLMWLCWKLAALFWLFMAPPQVMQIQNVQMGTKQKQVPNISSFAPFQEKSTAPSGTQADLPMLLKGVMLSQPTYLSAAVISMNNIGQRYRVGEAIEDTGFELAEVYWDKVVLKTSSGATRELSFVNPNANAQSAAPAAPLAGFNSAVPAAAAPTQAQHVLGLSLDKLKNNQNAYLNEVGIQRTEKGFEVTDRTPAEFRQKLGLRAGDQILSINGQSVRQGQNDLSVLEQARQDGRVKIEIQRGDQTMTIQQSF